MLHPIGYEYEIVKIEDNNGTGSFSTRYLFLTASNQLEIQMAEEDTIFNPTYEASGITEKEQKDIKNNQMTKYVDDANHDNGV